MNLKTFLSRDEAGDFAKEKRMSGFKTTLRTFNNGSKDFPAIRFIVRWA